MNVIKCMSTCGSYSCAWKCRFRIVRFINGHIPIYIAICAVYVAFFARSVCRSLLARFVFSEIQCLDGQVRMFSRVTGVTSFVKN